MSTRPIGSTHRGLTGWVVQRITSIYMAGFVVFLVVRFALAPMEGYGAWRAWWDLATARIALALFIGSLLVHSWLGLRSVWMDYLKPLWLRFVVSMLTAAALLLLALWSARLLLIGPG